MSDGEPLPPLPEPELEEVPTVLTPANLRLAIAWWLPQGVLTIVLHGLFVLGMVYFDDRSSSVFEDTWRASFDWDLLFSLLQTEFLGLLAYALVVVPVCFVFLHARGRLATRKDAFKWALVAWSVAGIASGVVYVSMRYVTEMANEPTPLVGIQGVMEPVPEDPVALLLLVGSLFAGTLVYGLVVFGRLQGWTLPAQVALAVAWSLPLRIANSLLWAAYYDVGLGVQAWELVGDASMNCLVAGVALAVGWRLGDALDARLARLWR